MSWISKRLSASPERLCSMELVKNNRLNNMCLYYYHSASHGEILEVCVRHLRVAPPRLWTHWTEPCVWGEGSCLVTFGTADSSERTLITVKAGYTPCQQRHLDHIRRSCSMCRFVTVLHSAASCLYVAEGRVGAMALREYERHFSYPILNHKL